MEPSAAKLKECLTGATPASGTKLTPADMWNRLKGEVHNEFGEDFDEKIWALVRDDTALKEFLESLGALTEQEWIDESTSGALADWAIGAYYGAIKADKSAPGLGGKGGGWARNSTRREAMELVAKAREEKLDALKQALFDQGMYTIHHKVSQANLKKLAEKIEQDPEMLLLFRHVLGSDNVEKALLNLAANLEVGPYGARRIGDPGSGFDPNRKDGSMTPRSALLFKLDQMIESGHWDLKTALALLQEIKGVHDQTYGEGLSAPQTDQWTPKKDGKFERQ